MNALQQAQAAYANPGAPMRTARGTEYDAFARVTRLLRDAARRPGAHPAMAEALHANRRLWTTLAADVAGADNRLASELRAQIFYLAEFSHVHGRKVLRGDAEVGPLLEVNAAVMRGLRQQGPDA